MNNVFLLNQSAFTIAPIVIGGLIFLMLITLTWKKEKLLMINLIADGVCLSLVNFGHIKECILIITATLSLSVIYAIFRKRETFNNQQNST